MTASKRPSLLTWSATNFVSAMLARSPTTMSSAPAIFLRVSSARAALRACSTTLCPCSIRSSAAIFPRPSAEPVTKTRAILGSFLYHREKTRVQERSFRDHQGVRIGATGRAWPCKDRCCSEIERGPLAGLDRPYSSLERPLLRCKAVIGHNADVNHALDALLRWPVSQAR